MDGIRPTVKGKLLRELYTDLVDKCVKTGKEKYSKKSNNHGRRIIVVIVMNSQKQCISYIIEDRNTKQTERFDLQLKIVEESSLFAFEASNLFNDPTSLGNAIMACHYKGFPHLPDKSPFVYQSRCHC
jgi:hypothetical protein